MKKVAVIGSGFAGLSAASRVAQAGFDVTVFEKNATAGGRARQFDADGFVFDMGPSWYWMPDVFESFFQRFDKTAADYYQLKRLDPSYRIYFSKDDYLDIPAGIEPLCALFEQLEPGSSKHLLQFMKEGAYKYELGINKLVYKPGLSVLELADLEVLKGVFRLHVFQSLSQYVRKFFKHPRIIKLLEFPVLFLGATADKTPALYSLMNYADMALGTWYPMGGMYKVIEAMVKVAGEQGVKFEFNSPVTGIDVSGKSARGVQTARGLHPADYVVAGADYHHVEHDLIDESHRRYSQAYWNSRTLAPSSLIFFVGINKRLKRILHHTLFFDEEFGLHAREIYETPRWPTAPQFYVSCTSQTDPSVAPEGHENLFFLIPVAPALNDDPSIREKYFGMVIRRFEDITGESIRGNIVYTRSYAHNDFITDYNAFRGNAYGLANTLTQTANLKPGIKNKKVTNLFYTGQLTVPGPGVPPSIISGQVVADALIKQDAAAGRIPVPVDAG